MPSKATKSQRKRKQHFTTPRPNSYIPYIVQENSCQEASLALFQARPPSIALLLFIIVDIHLLRDLDREGGFLVNSDVAVAH